MTRTAVAAAELPPLAAVDGLEPIPFVRLLRVEWRKQLDTRAARWLLLSSALLTLLAAAIPVIWPNDVPQDLPSYLGLVTLAGTILLPVIALLTMTTEWTRRSLLTTFTQEPRRGRVIMAKLLAGLGLGVIGTGFGFVAAVGGLALSDGIGRTVSWQIAPREVVGAILVMLLSVVMAMAFGALLQNTAAAIVVYLVLPMLFSLLALALKGVREWLDTAITFDWMLSGEWAGHTPQILTSIGVWAVAPLVAGLIRTARREVS
jgi:ABC-2 type transport system permease protein